MSDRGPLGQSGSTGMSVRKHGDVKDVERNEKNVGDVEDVERNEKNVGDVEDVERNEKNVGDVKRNEKNVGDVKRNEKNVGDVERSEKNERNDVNDKNEKNDDNDVKNVNDVKNDDKTEKNQVKNDKENEENVQNVIDVKNDDKNVNDVKNDVKNVIDVKNDDKSVNDVKNEVENVTNDVKSENDDKIEKDVKNDKIDKINEKEVTGSGKEDAGETNDAETAGENNHATSNSAHVENSREGNNADSSQATNNASAPALDSSRAQGDSATSRPSSAPASDSTPADSSSRAPEDDSNPPADTALHARSESGISSPQVDSSRAPAETDRASTPSSSHAPAESTKAHSDTKAISKDSHKVISHETPNGKHNSAPMSSDENSADSMDETPTETNPTETNSIIKTELNNEPPHSAVEATTTSGNPDSLNGGSTASPHSDSADIEMKDAQEPELQHTTPIIPSQSSGNGIKKELSDDDNESASVKRQKLESTINPAVAATVVHSHNHENGLDGSNTTLVSSSDAANGNSDGAKKENAASSSTINHKKHNISVVPPTKPQLFYTPLKTGLVYDVRMRYHAKIFTSYFEYIDPHPEDPRRIYRIYKRLAEAGLIQDTSLSGAEDIGPLMVKIPIREATSEEILEVHSEDHLRFISATETMSRQQLLEETEKGDSIYVNNDSFLSAKLSCGGTIEACKAVIEGKVKNSLAIVRPPGHHAEPDTPGGFCLFSNVAVAAKNILKTYPESVRKIVILDWDIHHGNGTQKSFYDDPRVLYISLHRYENGKFYPGTKYGCHTNSGEGPGEGFSLNIPWRSAGITDSDYMYAFRKVVIPVIAEFDPDLIIVSSGFDAADGDIIGGCHVTPAGYGNMTHMLKGIAKGKLAVILEGGYNLDSISKSALGVAKVLVGEPPEHTISGQPSLETLEVIDEVIKFQAKYWNCMKPGNPFNTFDDAYDLPTDSNTPAFKLSNIADPIRANQAGELFEKYSLISLPVLSSSDDKFATFSTDLPSHLEDLVVASPDIYDCSTIILSIHDPPEIWANLNPINGTIEASSSVVLEHPFAQVIEKISETSKSADFNSEGKIGYIDINIPSLALAFPSFTSKSDSDGKNGGSAGSDSSSNSTYNPTIFAQELLLYIWDNYISYFSQLKKMVFVGYGDSYQSIVHLYAKRPSQEIKDLVQGTVAFVNRSTLKPLVPVMDESMVDWYYRNSVIFTSCLNPCWVGNGSAGARSNNGGSGDNGDDTTKRPRRKFGRVLKTSVDGLWDVISERFDEGVDFILDSIEDFSSSDASN